METMLTKADDNPSRNRIRPFRRAMASMTSATPIARPPGMTNCKNRPTKRPPAVGIKRTCQTGISATRLTSFSAKTPYDSHWTPPIPRRKAIAA
jgi:hypothetical protein